jgi:hypothetical protein
MIAKRFGFTRDFLRERNTRVVLPTEENLLWMQRSSEGASANGLSGFNATEMRVATREGHFFE